LLDKEIASFLKSCEANEFVRNSYHFLKDNLWRLGMFLSFTC